MASIELMNQSAPSAEAARLNSQGMLALRAHSFVEAERLFLEATTHDKFSSALWRNVATARRSLGDDKGELQALNAAIDADRRDFMAWLRKAQLHQRTEEKAEALVAWSGVLQMAAQASDLSPEISSALQIGQTFVAEATVQIADAVGAELAPLNATMDEMERRRSSAFVDLALGRRQSFVNNCEGLYYPFLPADEFFDRRHFPWMSQIEAATDDIRTELEALLSDPGDALRPYVKMDAGVPQNKWSELDQSLNWGACFLWEYGQPNQAVLDRCPKTAEALANLPKAMLPGRAPSAFFSILKPRTRIPPHTGVTNTRAIVHLPLLVPENCGFRVGGETRPWQVGRAFAFDDTIEHEAWNDSDENRAILIFDVWNPHLTVVEQDVIVRYYDAADATGFNISR
ncbi:aspartyl/asparaginyl beta-hydroxylase domain-containing protein [Sphingorhabdus sp.]|uniref:aspartyl/asparaginyl beta-hydroxylase domain-containing protein n=1 Tax=Sphingorhabdus sp. TaxID=1902408 RepID=UPI003919D227